MVRASNLYSNIRRSCLIVARTITSCSFVRSFGLASLIAATSISEASAQITGGTQASTILQNIGAFILGPFGQSIAGLGIIAIGLSWMFGRASLGLIAGVIGGIVIMFGASFLVTTLVGGG